MKHKLYVTDGEGQMMKIYFLKLSVMAAFCSVSLYSFVLQKSGIPEKSI